MLVYLYFLLLHYPFNCVTAKIQKNKNKSWNCWELKKRAMPTFLVTVRTATQKYTFSAILPIVLFLFVVFNFIISFKGWAIHMYVARNKNMLENSYDIAREAISNNNNNNKELIPSNFITFLYKHFEILTMIVMNYFYFFIVFYFLIYELFFFSFYSHKLLILSFLGIN